MGCDIHMLTERRLNNKEAWVNTDLWKYEEYEQEEVGETPNLELQDVYSDRNYGLFARLAGVRKYGEEPPTFMKPRGVPWDVSAISNREIERWGSDGHSHSFATYKELEEFWWTSAYDSKGFSDLMHALKERMKEVFWLGNKEPDEEHKKNFRVVFFFDN